MNLEKYPDLENIWNIEKEYRIKRKTWFEDHCNNFFKEGKCSSDCKNEYCYYSDGNPIMCKSYFEYKD